MRLDTLQSHEHFTKIESGRSGEVLRVGDMGVMIRWHGLEMIEKQKWDEQEERWVYSTSQQPYHPVMISGAVEVERLEPTADFLSLAVGAPRKRGRPKGSKNKKPSKRERGK